jgi:hypothetical protein
MKVDSPSDLETAFARWRRSKRQVREAVPEELLERARRSMEVHGAKAVVRATKLERSRLLRGRKGDAVARKRRGVRPEAIPSFSRFELSAPSTSSRPVFEVETPAGVKVRLFSETPAALALLSSLCGGGLT